MEEILLSSWAGWLLLMQISIEHAVADGFVDVVGLDGFGVCQVGDGAGDAEDFVVGAGRKAVLRDGVAEHVAFRVAEGAELAELTTVELSVDSMSAAAEPSSLNLASLSDLLAHDRTARARRAGG